MRSSRRLMTWPRESLVLRDTNAISGMIADVTVEILMVVYGRAVANQPQATVSVPGSVSPPAAR